jgi:hypothetical protein
VTGVAPAGWPTDLPPPFAEEFGAEVAGWLLDRGPGEWRAHPVLRQFPQALGLLVADHLEAELTGLRRSYRSVRSEMGDAVPPDRMGDLLAAIEAQAAVVTESGRQVALVREALAGRRWRPRL